MHDDPEPLVVGVHRRVQHADVGADTDQVQLLDPPRAQDKLEIGAREGAVARLVHPDHVRFVAVCFEDGLQAPVQLPSFRPREIVRREQLRLGMIRIVLAMDVDREHDQIAGVDELTGQCGDLLLDGLRRFAAGQGAVGCDEVVRVIDVDQRFLHRAYLPCRSRLTNRSTIR